MSRRSTRPDLPGDGWTCLGVRYARAAGGKVRCEWCGTAICWAHRLTHPAGPTLETGCCCAANLCTGSGYHAKGAERAAVNRRMRLMTFVSKQWRRSKKNPDNWCRTLLVDGRPRYSTTIWFDRATGRYRVIVNGPGKAKIEDGVRVSFDDIERAKHYAFDLIEAHKTGTLP